MKRIITLSVLLAAFSLNRASAEEIWIDISDFAFSPQEIWVDEGATVTWMNYDPAQHTVTSDANLFDSGLLSQGETWSYTFNVMGNYPYHCTPHPYMTGQVHVMMSSNMSLDLTLMPGSSSIIIPSSGGSFEYTTTVTNETMMPWNLDYWTKVYLPNDNPYPLFGPANFTLPATTSRSRLFEQLIPQGAPAGTYRFVAYLGTYPDELRAFDSFEFTKSPASGFDLSGWTTTPLTPWSDEDQMNVISQAELKEVTLWNAPEPFNPSTLIHYTLPEGGVLKLDVFNLQGAKVATLVNGSVPAGQHQVTFDAGQMPSGMYLYRLNYNGKIVSGKMMLMK